MLSVVIPTLNENNHLYILLRCLENQTYDNFEAIVSDGGSTDGTVSVAERLADKVVSSEDETIAEGRNKGAEIAEGDILVFLDADTRISDEFLEKVAAFFEDNDVVGATCNYTCIERDFVNRFCYFLANKSTRFLTKIGVANFPGFCSFYRKGEFEELGGFDEDLNHTEDIELGKRIRETGEVGFIDSTRVATSARRIDDWGYPKLWSLYIMNFLLFHFRGRIYSMDY